MTGHLQRAADRLSFLFDSYPTVVVSVSGGKDSTCLAELALETAPKGARLIVSHYDEEIVLPWTEAYIQRLAARVRAAGHEFRHWAVPLRMPGAWGNTWRSWAPGEPWVRPRPPGALTEHPAGAHDLPGLTRISPLEFRGEPFGSVAVCAGVQRSESLARKRRTDWLVQPSRRRTTAFALPLLDWPSSGSWAAIRERGWDWNRGYHWLFRAGEPRRFLRIGSVVGPDGSREFACWRRLCPQRMAKIYRRLPWARALAAYAHSPICGRGKVQPDADGAVDWRAVHEAVESLPESQQRQARRVLRAAVGMSIGRPGAAIRPREVWHMLGAANSPVSFRHLAPMQSRWERSRESFTRGESFVHPSFFRRRRGRHEPPG